MLPFQGDNYGAVRFSKSILQPLPALGQVFAAGR